MHLYIGQYGHYMPARKHVISYIRIATRIYVVYTRTDDNFNVVYNIGSVKCVYTLSTGLEL